MPLSKEEVQHIAILCRIGMTEEEMERMGEQLSHILEQFEVLQQVDTEDVPATAHSVALESVFRPDEVRPSTEKEDVLVNAPRRQDDFFQVMVVLEE